MFKYTPYIRFELVDKPLVVTMYPERKHLTFGSLELEKWIHDIEQWCIRYVKGRYHIEIDYDDVMEINKAENLKREQLAYKLHNHNSIDPPQFRTLHRLGIWFVDSADAMLFKMTWLGDQSSTMPEGKPYA